MALDPHFAESIRQVEVCFGFMSFLCDPDEITKTLGVVPDEVRRQGDLQQTATGRTIAVPFNSWSIASTVDSKDVNDHCRQVLSRLSGAIGRLDARWGTPSFSVTYKATHLCSGNGPVFEVDVVQGIAALGAELWQDIYSLDEDGP